MVLTSTELISLALKCVGVYGLSYAAWFILSPFIKKSPLDDIPGPPSQSWLAGNMAQVFDSNGWAFHKHLARTYGGLVKLHSWLGNKQLYVSDPKALYHILLKDSHIFEETETFVQCNRLIFGMGLLSTLGDHHRKQRKMLNPVFSINHMRNMIPTFYEITHKLKWNISAMVQNGPQEIEMLEWTTRTALELIGRSGLGYSFDSLDKGSNHPYTTAVKNLSPTVFALAIFRPLVPLIVKLGSPNLRRTILELLPWKQLQTLRGVVDVMDQTSRTIFAEKKRAIEQGDDEALQQMGGGKDIMSILLKQNMEASEHDRLPDDELLGQMSTLTFAAMDTTSGALARIFHLLAQHPTVQAKLRKEVVEASEDGDTPYDQLVSLPYLDAVCRETLRLYAPIPFIGRKARTDGVLPLLHPVKDVYGRLISEVPVPAGTDILVGIPACNTNVHVWGPDADQWKPERWLEPLPKSVSEAGIPGVYSNLMTFSGGGRSCIGFKFAQLEMKVVLSLLLRSFEFSLSRKEISWRLGVVTTPVINSEQSNSKIALPLMVRLLEESEL